MTLMVGVQEVLDACETVLRDHLASYVQELFDTRGLQLPGDIEIVQVPLFEIDALAAADALQLPTLALSSPGLAGQAQRAEGGTYDATFEVVATVVCRDDTAAATGRQARGWGLVVRSCLLGHSALAGLGTLTWVDESYAPLPVKNSRTLGGAIGIFHVDVEAVAEHGSSGSVGVPVTSIELEVQGYGPTHPALVEGT